MIPLTGCPLRWTDWSAREPRPVCEALQAIEAHRLVIDAQLKRAASFRGELRRELSDRTGALERSRVQATFDSLVQLSRMPEPPAIDRYFLGWVHDSAVGGRVFRTGQLRVGVHHAFPEPERLNGLIADTLERARSGGEPPALAAARLHLDLLVIHPFRDGNGRTARLLGSYLLLRSGFKSTLFTALEQHFSIDPPAYISVLDAYRFGQLDGSGCLARLLEAMAYRSMLAAWFCNREHELRRRLTGAGVARHELERELARFELGSFKRDGWAGAEIVPWNEAGVGPSEEGELHDQLDRLCAETSWRPR